MHSDSVGGQQDRIPLRDGMDFLVQVHADNALGHGTNDAPRVFRDPRRGQPAGMGSLFDAMLALSGGALYRDRRLLYEVGA